MNRFNYIKYDKEHEEIQKQVKEKVQEIEKIIDKLQYNDHFQFSATMVSKVENCRNAMKALEECYMWIGKILRDDQMDKFVSDVTRPNDDEEIIVFETP